MLVGFGNICVWVFLLVEDCGGVMISVLKGVFYEEVLWIEFLVEGIDRGIFIFCFDFLDEVDLYCLLLVDEVVVYGGDVFEYFVDVVVCCGGFKLFDGMILVCGFV